jgi:hypothetical protein
MSGVLPTSQRRPVGVPSADSPLGSSSKLTWPSAIDPVSVAFSFHQLGKGQLPASDWANALSTVPSPSRSQPSDSGSTARCTTLAAGWPNVVGRLQDACWHVGGSVATLHHCPAAHVGSHASGGTGGQTHLSTLHSPPVSAQSVTLKKYLHSTSKLPVHDWQFGLMHLPS